MTLNVTTAAPDYIVQASDRRMVAMPSGKPESDAANKGLVLEAEDGLFAITFAGIGRYEAMTTDKWLAERMADEGVPELPIRTGVSMIADLATEWFATFPKSVDRRHTFVITGWEHAAPQPAARIWSVGNCVADDGRSMAAQANDQFEVVEHRIRAGLLNTIYFGLHEAIQRPDRRRMAATLRKGTDPDRVEAAMVDLIRAAASKPEWAWGINCNVLSIAISPQREARVTFYPEAASARTYAPWFVWHRGKCNFIAGNADITASATMGFRFGSSVIVAPPGGVRSRASLPEPTKVEATTYFRLSNAKFKQDDEPDDGFSLGGFAPLLPP